MADRAVALIEDLIERIISHRKAKESLVLYEQISTLDPTAPSFAEEVGKLHGQHFLKIVDQTLDELERGFKESRRRDGDFFWNAVNAKLQAIYGALNVEFNNAAVDWARTRAIQLTEGFPVSSIASSAYSAIGGNIFSLIVHRINELRVRARFVAMKSPQDRRANQIPDVAVMMWFPSKEDGDVAITEACARYEAIKEAVRQASNGLATVDKIDNPALLHTDRISPSVETWLEKSVLVICDLGGNRANVFYEFGFARAIGTDVIAIKPRGDKTAFHLAQWATDEYGDVEELKTNLMARVKTALSRHELSGMG